MDTLATSFANLVKNNNGFFKSPMQAGFLLSKCDATGQYISAGQVHGNQYNISYFCDQKGVVRVEKYTPKSGKIVVQWERKEEGKMSAQDEKEIKRLKRLIKQTESSIADRDAARARGEYANDQMYQKAQQRDKESLATLQQMLSKVGKGT